MLLFVVFGVFVVDFDRFGAFCLVLLLDFERVGVFVFVFAAIGVCDDDDTPRETLVPMYIHSNEKSNKQKKPNKTNKKTKKKQEKPVN